MITSSDDGVESATPSTESGPSEYSRRSMLKRGAVIGGTLAWTIPAIQVISMNSAQAESASAPAGPGKPKKPKKPKKSKKPNPSRRPNPPGRP